MDPLEADNRFLATTKSMNGEAIIEIFDIYAPVLYRYALRLSNDAVMANQIVGDVFAKLLEYLSADRGPNFNIRSYLFEITYHTFIDEVRYFRRAAPIEGVDLTVADGHSTQVSAEDRVLIKAVLRAIMNDLTEDQRHVIILRFAEGFSVKETALIIGKKVGNVKVIQNRAMAALRRALHDHVVETVDISFMIRSMAYI